MYNIILKVKTLVYDCMRGKKVVLIEVGKFTHSNSGNKLKI